MKTSSLHLLFAAESLMGPLGDNNLARNDLSLGQETTNLLKFIIAKVKLENSFFSELNCCKILINYIFRCIFWCCSHSNRITNTECHLWDITITDKLKILPIVWHSEKFMALQKQQPQFFLSEEDFSTLSVNFFHNYLMSFCWNYGHIFY